MLIDLTREQLKNLVLSATRIYTEGFQKAIDLAALRQDKQLAEAIEGIAYTLGLVAVYKESKIKRETHPVPLEDRIMCELEMRGPLKHNELYEILEENFYSVKTAINKLRLQGKIQLSKHGRHSTYSAIMVKAEIA